MSADLPLISVVVPSSQPGRFLEQALASIRDQQYPRTEVVVASGESVAAIEADVSRAGGALLAWLDPDDYYCEDALWRVARAYERHPGFGLYIGNGLHRRESDGRTRPFCRRHLALRRGADVEGLDRVLRPATFISRAAWAAAGGVDPSPGDGLDWDRVLSIARDRPAVLINEFLAVGRELADARTDAPAADEFPETGDPQDVVDLPTVRSGASAALRVRSFDPPSISIVTPSYQQAPFLREALDSVLDQGYPRVESIVRDGGSTDGSVEVLREYGGRLASWTSAPDRGPAHAINEGLGVAKGEILSWLNSDDLLAEGALWEVGRAFAEDPDLDVVYGNALYVDGVGALATADHGGFRTGLYYGAFQPLDRIPFYWTYVHSVPQPTVFFRRRLLERCGRLDESYHFIFDFELFGRFVAQGARIRKLERTLAFYRLHEGAKTSDWTSFLVELYRFSRPRWPAFGTREYRAVLRGFLDHAVARRFVAHRGWRFWVTALAAGASAVTRIGNPERLRQLGRARRAGQTT